MPALHASLPHRFLTLLALMPPCAGLGLRLRFHHATMALPIGLAAQGGVFRPQEHRYPTRLGRELVAVKLHGRVEVGTILRTEA